MTTYGGWKYSMADSIGKVKLRKSSEWYRKVAKAYGQHAQSGRAKLAKRVKRYTNLQNYYQKLSERANDKIDKYPLPLGGWPVMLMKKWLRDKKYRQKAALKEGFSGIKQPKSKKISKSDLAALKQGLSGIKKPKGKKKTINPESVKSLVNDIVDNAIKNAKYLSIKRRVMAKRNS